MAERPSARHGARPSLVIGVGARRGAALGELLGLIGDSLRTAGLPPFPVVELATVDTRADEPCVVEAARRLGVPLCTYPAALLAGIAVPNPSGASLAAVGTPSVAEAAALAGGGRLLVAKRVSPPPGGAAAVTCAIAVRS